MPFFRFMICCVVVMATLSCGYGKRVYLLSKSAGEYTRQEVRFFPEDYDTVWKAIDRALYREYVVYMESYREGTIFTKWKSTLTRKRAYFHEKRDMLNGIPANTNTDFTPREELGEFEVETRLEFVILKNPGGGTTVSITCIYRIAPPDILPRDYTADRFANKIFSPWEFNVQEDFRLLEKIKKTIENQRKPG